MAGHPAKLLNLWDVLDDTVVTTEGCYVRGFRLRGLDSLHLSGATLLTSASRLYERFKRDFDEDLHLQFVMNSHHDCKNVLGAYKATAPTGSILKRQHNRRVQFLEQSGIRRHDCYVFVSRARGLSQRQFAQISEQIHRKRLASAQALATTVRSALEAAGIDCELLSTSELWHLLEGGIEPSRPGNPQTLPSTLSEMPSNPVHIDPLSPRDRLLRCEIQWDDNHVQVGGHFYKVLTLKELPAQTTFTMMEALGQIPVDFRLSINVQIPAQRPIASRLQRFRRFKNATAHNAHVSDDQAQSELKSANDLSTLLAESGQMLVLLGMQLVLWAQSKEELDRRVATVMGKLKTVGLGWFEETRAHDLELFKSLPGLSLRFDRHLVMTSNNAVDLLPLFTPEHGDRNPALLMHTASGHHLFGFDPYERNRDNWNAAIFGASGTGKSVVMNMLITGAMLGHNHGCGRVLVVDFAGPKKSSYKMLCDLFGGDYLTVVGSHKTCLNPFPLPKDALDADGALRGDVLARLVVMTDLLIENAADGQESARNRVIIQNALCDAYKAPEGKRPSYRDVLAVMEGYHSHTSVHAFDPGRVRALTELLRGFVDGPYEALFSSDEDSPSSTQGTFTIYDLFGVEGLPKAIQEALVYLVCGRVRDLAFDPNDARMKTIVLDEVARLIQQPAMLGLFEELYDTARGYNTSIWTVTQKYLAYCKSALAETVQINSTTAAFMSHAEQAEAVRRRIVEDWNFNGREAALFRSLRSVKGEFSELLLRTEVFDARRGKRPVTAKLKLLLSPLDYEIVTSDRLDRERQQEFIARNPDLPLVDALEKLAMQKRRAALRRQGHGVESLERVA